jgi:HEAT repeat protein
MRFLRAAGCVLLTGVLALGVPQDREAVQSRLRRVERRVRERAAGDPSARETVALLRDAGPAAAPLAIDLLGQGKPEVRAGAAMYLGLLRSRQAVPALIKLLEDPEPRVRRIAAAALGLTGDPRARYFLRRTMTADEPRVAEAARRALQRLERPGNTESLRDDHKRN